MLNVNIDPHVHLYDFFPLDKWYLAAVNNLQVGPTNVGVVIVLDRIGQDSFARIRREVSSFGRWEETQSEGESTSGVIRGLGGSLIVLKGVQYVSEEKLEVLGLGVVRSEEDGTPFDQLIDRIANSGGIPYIPWSPGKWLGARGNIVSRSIRERLPGKIVFGDIAMRSLVGPPSLILAHAQRAGFNIVCGTDPLPIPRDFSLVGSYGFSLVAVALPPIERVFSDLLKPILEKAAPIEVWGKANGPIKAARRFLACMSSRVSA